ncbi:MAG: ATP-dependent zinc metalloprotease FtsH [Acidimicrobiales bacterium]|nr:ATP-dependent zinc metalloprotease FtsH [Acidimicrobiales bacterium]
MSEQGPNLPPPQQGRNPRLPGSKGEGSVPRWAILVVSAVIITLLVVAVGGGTSNSAEEISYTEFIERVENGQVAKISFDNATFRIDVTTNDDPPVEYRTTSVREIPEKDLQLLEENDVTIEAFTDTGSALTGILSLFLPLGLIILFFWWISRRQQSQMGGIMSVGRSKAKTYTTERPGTTFADVAGYDGVKREITEVVDFLKYPAKFGEIGARIPKGVLLVGPPGTGKTLIARAVAGEAGVPFMSVTGSDFMEMFVGVGASRVRDLFAEARKMGRAIIFVDEIDSIGRKRGSGMGGGHDEREQTLNQMLAEMDGFEPTEGIVMMAATNRPDILDPALLRPGRFDRQVVVPLPELDDRKEILKVHSKHKKMADDVDISVIARGTPGMSGADLANLVNEAALFAVRQGKAKISAEHFDQARDRVLIGIERESMVRSPEELERTAYHEAGHALCAALLPTHDPVHKVTIIPTGMALGVTMTLPLGDRHKLEKTEAEERIIMALGGRNAERVVFGEMSSGASDDLRQATQMARRMVSEWGMSDTIGPMSLSDNGPVFLGGEMMGTREFSEQTAHLIDSETRQILVEMEVRCKELLESKRGALNLIARSLLEHETVSGAEVDRLIALAENNPAAASIEPETAENLNNGEFTSGAEGDPLAPNMVQEADSETA